jgi:cellulose synthase (UDP-forming)
MGGCRIAVPDDRHLQDDIEEIELILQSGAICIPAEQVTADEALFASSLMKIFSLAP